METTNITSYDDLVLHIMHLKVEKFKQEEALKNTFMNFISSLYPVSIIKATIHKLAEDKEVQLDITKVGLNMGTNLIIDQIFGKNRSIKGFLSSILIEKFSNSLINNNTSKIMSIISKLVHRVTDQ